MPANEVLFFPDAAAARRRREGQARHAVTGPVMNVTNSRLVVDSSLSVSDAALVRLGDPVDIEEQDLAQHARHRARGLPDAGHDTRGTPSRPAASTSPSSRPGRPSLVGASVKLTIAVKSTKRRRSSPSR